MKYYVVNGIGCYYHVSEDEYIEYGEDDIVATCNNEAKAKRVAKALAMVDLTQALLSVIRISTENKYPDLGTYRMLMDKYNEVEKAIT